MSVVHHKKHLFVHLLVSMKGRRTLAQRIETKFKKGGKLYDNSDNWPGISAMRELVKL